MKFPKLVSAVVLLTGVARADASDILVGTAGGGAYIGHDNDMKKAN